MTDQVRGVAVEGVDVIIREHQIPYGLGTVTVRDYGGTGPDVLLVHAAGFCARAWDTVAEALDGKVHAYAVDLPGHGGSTARMRRATDAWNSLVTVTHELGLTTPLLVGIAQGSHAALAATLEAPGEFAGVVTLGGACIRTADSAADDIMFYTSREFTGLLQSRFAFGYRVYSERDVEHFVRRMETRLARDWRAVGFKGLADEIRYSLRPAEDGDGWVNLPVPETITTMLSIERGDKRFPDEALYRRIEVPVVVVQLSEGLDVEHAQRERDLAIRHPLVSVRGLETGDYPHYTRPHEVAAIVLETCGLGTLPQLGPTATHAHAG